MLRDALAEGDVRLILTGTDGQVGRPVTETFAVVDNRRRSSI
jgi:hypothetical protein